MEVQLDWREKIHVFNPTLKLKDKESAIFTFVDEGQLIESDEYGESVAFNVKEEASEELRTFFVNALNYKLLGEIKKIGKLSGKRVQVKREGSGKKDTKYELKVLD